MSIPEKDLIEQVRRIYAAFNRGDFDAAIEIAHPEIVFARPGAQSDLTGPETLRAWMEPDAFEDQRFEPFEFRVEGDKVLVRQHTTARGAGSGIKVELDTLSVWTFDEDGRVTRLENFFVHDEAEALRALGAD
jgi:ketosteroid isomerase-like protein